MRVILNSIIPFEGFKAINLFGVVFQRRGTEMSPVDLNHEMYHTRQMQEMLYIFFYIWYFIEWLVRLVTNPGHAYRSISFEREAFDNQGRMDASLRRHFAWMKYLKR